MGLILMVNQIGVENQMFESPEIQPVIDEKMLPDLIQGQVDKLNELDASVKKAIEAAELAELNAKKAKELSEGKGFFTFKSREAIEELQSAGIELAGAVQSGAKAQKISFEFQTRLADITKYLFGLGVSNIAVNRIVLRQLEMCLGGASGTVLSDLAQQEITSVVRQLKEQEDLLKKQQRMNEVLKEHDLKLKYLLEQIDGIDDRLKDQRTQQIAFVDALNIIDQLSKQQQIKLLATNQRVLRQHGEIEKIASALSLLSSSIERVAASNLSALNLRTALLVFFTITLFAAGLFLA